MTAEALIREAKPAEALEALQQEIRANPSDARLRIFLFQLLSVLGKWDKALSQLAVLRDLDADCMLFAQIFTPVVHCEIFRAEVSAGKRAPLIFGEPDEWIGLLVQANQHIAQGNFDAAAELRAKAYDAAPATPGRIGEVDFEWIADADSRLGPLLEVIMDGKYYWVPFSRIRTIRFEAPTDLRNLVWTSAHFTWATGGETPAFIPTRYSGSENAEDAALAMARKTVWNSHPGETFLGSGQRMLATDVAEYPLQEIKVIDLQTSEPAALSGE